MVEVSFKTPKKWGFYMAHNFKQEVKNISAVDVMFFWNKLMMNGAPGCPLPASPSPFEQSAQYVLLRGW
jgi:hypothetical protein